MKGRKLSKSLRKYVRREKARIRREVWDLKEQEKLIEQLYQEIFKRYIIKKNSNISEKK